MELTEIVMKSVGKIRPVGETNQDNINFENLKTLCDLVRNLVSEIDSVAYDFKDSYEFSVKRASDYANDFLIEQFLKAYEEYHRPIC